MSDQIPSTWKQVPLRNICERIDYGYTASAQQDPVGPKFLRITDIVPNLIDWASVPYCEVSGANEQKYHLQEGDIVIARTGATTGYAKRVRNHPSSVFASYLVRIRVKPEHDDRYVGLVVESDEYKRFIKANLGGAAQPQANAQVLTSFPILLPPLPTQRKIAAILSAYDDLIEVNTRRIAILEEMARSLYREWFVRFRFPGHEGMRLVESAVGVVPEGWEVKTLGHVVELAYGKGLKADTRLPGTVPVYGSAGVIGYHNESLVKGPGVIVGRKGNVGSVFWSGEDFFPIDTVFYVQTKLELHYVFYALQDQHFINSDAAVPGLSRNQAYLNPFLVPEQDTMTAFAEFVVPIFAQTRNLRQENANLRRTRDLLLPRLVSGEVAVGDLDHEVAKEREAPAAEARRLRSDSPDGG